MLSTPTYFAVGIASGVVLDALDVVAALVVFESFAVVLGGATFVDLGGATTLLVFRGFAVVFEGATLVDLGGFAVVSGRAALVDFGLGAVTFGGLGASFALAL